MALSDACFEFLETVASAAGELAQSAHHYSDPGGPFEYGTEVDALRRACKAFRDSPYDPEAGSRLIRLAGAILSYHDTPPSDSERLFRREAEMKELIRLLQTELDESDAAAVP